jgi:hypothetical protein
LENRHYGVIIEEIRPFLDENGFKEQDDAFVNDTKAVKISYDEAKQVYNLLAASVTEGKVGEYTTVTSYLFDENQTEKDAVSVAIDFCDELRILVGAKKKRVGGGETQLPTANASDAITVNTLVAKFLAIYPALKDVYKDETAKYGKFLYLDFCTTYVVPEIRRDLDENSKKPVKKLMDMMSELFVTGDKETSTLVVALLAAAIGKSEARFTAAADRLEDCTHLVTAVNNEIVVLAKNKKFAKAMNFEG